MSKFDMDMRRIEQAAARLTGDRQGAARFRKELTEAVRQAAAAFDPQDIADAIRRGKIGWVNDPARNKAVLVQAKTGCGLLDSKRKPFLGPRITYRKTPDINLNAFVTHLETPRIEGFSPHMYLDEGGNVTVGIGLNLETVQEAMTLPFVEKSSMKPAHAKHIENAYNKVKKAKPTGIASDFAQLTNLVISKADATILTLDFIDKLMIEIKSNVMFLGFDTFPVPAKMGVLDMVYTLGGPRLLAIYIRFSPAVRSRKWLVAPRESNRDNVSAKRNQVVGIGSGPQQKSNRYFSIRPAINHYSTEDPLDKCL